MKSDEHEPIFPVTKVAFSTARQQDIPKRVPAWEAYRFLRRGSGWTWRPEPIPADEK